MIAITLAALVHCSALTLASTAASFGPAQQSETPAWGKAPDGERGFGVGRSLRDLTRLLRSTNEEDKQLVLNWRDLEAKVRVLVSLARDRYKSEGYFALLGPGADASLERLGMRFRELEPQAKDKLYEPGAEAPVLAKLLVDPRFRARIAVLENVEFELSDLRGSLALLSATLDGFADLHDPEADAIARRSDLAATRLRAIKLDLEALREGQKDAAAEELWRKDQEELGALMHSTDRAKAEGPLQRLLERLHAREEQMNTTLFTVRMPEALEPLLARRLAACSSADEMLPAIRRLIPETEEGQQANKEIAGLGKTRRYSYAARDAATALSFDPLNEELCYLCGIATDFLQGGIESRRWFDRFLALRGIRAHDHRTYQGRELTREEKRALDALQIAPAQPK